jgi:hypothetical protein
VETGKQPHWMAAVYAGLIAGVVFLVLEMILVSLAGNSPWAPVRMIGAILMGRDVLPPPATFALGVFISALIVHFVLAIIYGLILSAIVFRLEEWLGLVVGAVFGLVLYWINFYGFTAVFPWFAEARGGLGILAHLVFGFVAAWSYKELTKRQIQQEQPPRL